MFLLPVEWSVSEGNQLPMEILWRNKFLFFKRLLQVVRLCGQCGVCIKTRCTF